MLVFLCEPLRPSFLCGEVFHSSTQVSFVPPPCDELTTSEPSFNATRVRPPGTVCTLLPDST